MYTCIADQKVTGFRGVFPLSSIGIISCNACPLSTPTPTIAKAAANVLWFFLPSFLDSLPLDSPDEDERLSRSYLLCMSSQNALSNLPNPGRSLCRLAK